MTFSVLCTPDNDNNYDLHNKEVENNDDGDNINDDDDDDDDDKRKVGERKRN